MLTGMGVVTSNSKFSDRQSNLQRGGVVVSALASLWLWAVMLALLVAVLVQGSLAPLPGSYRWIWVELTR